MGSATYWVIFSQTHLVTLLLVTLVVTELGKLITSFITPS
jgi:hypothetical protein